MLSKETIQKISEYVDSHREEITEKLQEFIRIPSVAESQTGTAGKPYGENCRRLLDEVVCAFRSMGFSDAQVSKNGHYATASIRGKTKKTIGMFTHGDVVPAGEGWLLTSSPFSPIIKNNCLIGRGAEDNKSALVMSMYIPQILKSAGISLNSDYMVYIGSAEETGMSDIDQYLEENAGNLPTLCLVPDGAFPVCKGEKSIFRFHAVSGSAFESILDFEGGMAYNTVLDKLCVKIQYTEQIYSVCRRIAAASCGEIVVSRAEQCILVEAIGIPRHAAMPKGGKNAAAVFATHFHEAPFLGQNDRQLLEDVLLLTSDMWGKALGISHQDALGELTFVNGMCRKLSDGRIDLSFDIRHGCSLKTEDLRRQMEQKLGKMGWSMDINGYIEQSMGYIHSEADGCVALLEEIYNRFATEATGTPAQEKAYCSAGGTYARKLPHAYTIGTHVHYKPSFAPQICMQLPEGHGGVHQRDEYLPLPMYFEAVKLTAVMVAEMDAKLNLEEA